MKDDVNFKIYETIIEHIIGTKGSCDMPFPILGKNSI